MENEQNVPEKTKKIYKKKIITPEKKNEDGSTTPEVIEDKFFNDPTCNNENMEYTTLDDNTKTGYEVINCPQEGGRRRRKSKKSKKAKKTKKAKKSKKTKKSRKH
jgi:hypothetical protein